MFKCPHCNTNINNNDIVKEVVETFYHDLENGETYTEKEQVPSTHEYEYSELIKYWCPECEEELDIE